MVTTNLRCYSQNVLPMPNSRSMTEHRLQLLRRRIISDSEIYTTYANFMTKLLDKGYTEVPKSQLDRLDGRVWNLPDHPVTQPKPPNWNDPLTN